MSNKLTDNTIEDVSLDSEERNITSNNLEEDDEYKYFKPNKARHQSKKSRTILLILFILFGRFGIHRLYSGNKKSALFLLLVGPIWQIVLNIIVHFNLYLLALSGFLSLINTIIALTVLAVLITDFINILTGSFKDSDGKNISSWKLKSDK
ncbi:MAG: TM2 domain-containing protein [Clostridium sp.]|nr:TM2 domain-containing protein [Clostridium sp.]